MSTLDGKVALVTGSSRGIGAAIAKLFAQQGARVALHGRDVAALSAVRADIEHAGGRVMQVAAGIQERSARNERTERRQHHHHLLGSGAPAPIRRLGTPEDVARAARFLASDEAGWITGIVLDVAGGSVLI